MKKLGQQTDPFLPQYPSDDADLGAWVSYSKELHRRLYDVLVDKQVRIDNVIPYTGTGALVLTSDVTGTYDGNIKWAAAAGGTTITTKDEGVTLSTTVDTLDFVGAGVTATGAGNVTTITIPGAAAGGGFDWGKSIASVHHRTYY